MKNTKFEIEVPDGIIKFLKSLNINVQQYVEESVELAFRADFEVFREDLKINMNVDELIKKYGLENFVWTYNSIPAEA